MSGITSTWKGVFFLFNFFSFWAYLGIFYAYPNGKQVEDAADLKLDEATLVKNLEAGSSSKFLGVKESILKDEKLALAVAAKVYLHKLSVIWTSPLSDANRVKATNQFALHVLTYPMWTQHCPWQR